MTDDMNRNEGLSSENSRVTMSTVPVDNFIRLL